MVDARNTACRGAAHFVALLAITLLCACGPAGAQHAGVEPGAESATRRAAQARAAAQRARSSPGVDGLELRLRDLSIDNIARSDGVEVAVRVPMRDNPWLGRAREEAWSAEAEAVLRELDEVALADQAERCQVSIELQSHELREALYARTVEQFESVLDWSAAWSEAGSLDELTAAELELELGLWRVEERPLPTRDVRDPNEARQLVMTHPLPALTPGTGVLRDAPQLVAAQIRSLHPQIATHQARAEAYRAEVVREQAAQLPWFDFFELGYSIAPDAGPEHIEAQVAFALPLGIAARGEEARHEALAASEDLEAARAMELLQRETADALVVLRAVEARSDELEALLELAERSEAVAMRWTDQRLGQPRQVARVFRDVYAARTAALDAREHAGSASCALLAATGAPLSVWPRQ